MERPVRLDRKCSFIDSWNEMGNGNKRSPGSQVQHCLLCAELQLNITRPVPVHTSLPLKHDRRESFAVLLSSRLSYLELTVNQITLQEAFTSLRLGAQDRLGVPPGHHKKLNPIPSFVLRTRSLIPCRGEAQESLRNKAVVEPLTFTKSSHLLSRRRS
jgi:hypothetical protein